MKEPLLIVFGGLPGTGKTALARGLAEQLKGFYLRIDTIEQALRNFNGQEISGEGYSVAYGIAEDNLRIGNIVVADSVNPIQVTREAWRGIALKTPAKLIEIEVVCSDQVEHRIRVETRRADITGHKMPAWLDVVSREYHPWTTKNITIDTAGKKIEAALDSLLKQVQKLC